MENETDHFRKRVRKGLGSSHTSARCVMFSFFIRLNVLLNFGSRQAGLSLAWRKDSRRSRAQAGCSQRSKMPGFCRNLRLPIWRRGAIQPAWITGEPEVGHRQVCLANGVTERSTKRLRA